MTSKVTPEMHKGLASSEARQVVNGVHTFVHHLSENGRDVSYLDPANAWQLREMLTDAVERQRFVPKEIQVAAVKEALYETARIMLCRDGIRPPEEPDPEFINLLTERELDYTWFQGDDEQGFREAMQVEIDSLGGGLDVSRITGEEYLSDKAKLRLNH